MKSFEAYKNDQEGCDDLLNPRHEFTQSEIAGFINCIKATGICFGERLPNGICPRCKRPTVYFLAGFGLGCSSSFGGCGAKPNIVKDESLPPYPDQTEIEESDSQFMSGN